MAASARLMRNCVTGRRELGEITNQRFSAPEFTPYEDRRLDEPRLAAMLDRWMDELGIAAGEFSAGGAIVTGFAAQAQNAAAVRRLVRQRIGDALIVTADDPCLESWAAFLGNSFHISREHPERTVLNLDIGGGTTNIAYGRNGAVEAVGSCYIGARHLRFESGTYSLTGVSSELAALLPQLGINPKLGLELAAEARQRVLEMYVATLEAIAAGNAQCCDSESAATLEQVPLDPIDDPDPIITLSGGVGELAYRIARGEPLPGTTAFGDLGIDFAERLNQSPTFAPHLKEYAPRQQGRATLYGVTVHNTEISGSTLFLPDKSLLPLSDLPIVGSVSAELSDAALQRRLELARRGSGGSCLLVEPLGHSASLIKEFGTRLAAALKQTEFPPAHPLVLLLTDNAGKTLGHYATEWGRLPLQLVVIDEIPVRRASFVSVGRPRENIVPLSFYGMENRL